VLADARATPAAVLKACRIDYRMPADAAATGLPAGTVDYVITANVLQHVPKPAVQGIFAEAHRLLPPDGGMYHHLHPRDRFAEDGRVTIVNFLKYSPWAWYYIGGSGVAYHNRLRGVDYVRLVEEAQFEITGQYSSTDARALERLTTGAQKVHPDFQGYTP